MEKPVEYYMGLPYTVELATDDPRGYKASLKELPWCKATAGLRRAWASSGGGSKKTNARG